ncbi:MAG: hypothetical protein GX409_09450 [candidate division Zixibacteria bacterium]|nr:hypothetical protein [candidate division Zixibacteria bacterium]
MLTTYESNPSSNFNSIYLKLVDLQNSVIQDSLLLANEGTICTPTPIKLQVGDSIYYITILSKGEYDKNTAVGRGKVFWWITTISNRINLIKYDSLLDVSVVRLENHLDKPYFSFGLQDQKNHLRLLEDGEYNLDSNLVFHKLNEISQFVGPNGLSSINAFSQFTQLATVDSSELFSAYGSDGKYWILRISNTNNLIIDSLRLFSDNPMSKIFVYHPARNILYCFFLNYVNYSQYPDINREYGQNWGIPIVIFYNPVTLNEIGRDTITDFSDGNYPGIEYNKAQIYGDYIVYYFSKSEGLNSFDPAMLFIFDTRTNEARWLRVGWR